MLKHQKFLALCLSLTASVAFAFPGEKPFDEQYPIASITNRAKADEVIEAYDKEMARLKQWRAQEDRNCNKAFFVNHCLGEVKETYTEESNRARKVWIVARDFIRKEKADEAASRRKQANAERQREMEARESQPPRQHKPKTVKQREPRKSGEEKNSNLTDINNDETRTTDRYLTKEQEEANRRAYEEKQKEREARIEEQSSKEPDAPRLTREEREKMLVERRKAAEAKRQANIKRRTEKALEYERQLKLRQEQELRGAEEISPIIFK